MPQPRLSNYLPHSQKNREALPLSRKLHSRHRLPAKVPRAPFFLGPWAFNTHGSTRQEEAAQPLPSEPVRAVTAPGAAGGTGGT